MADIKQLNNGDLEKISGGSNPIPTHYHCSKCSFEQNYTDDNFPQGGICPKCGQGFMIED